MHANHEQAFGTACDVAAAFLITFVTPYLLPSMGVNIGWIFGSVACFSIIWGSLFFPELKVSTNINPQSNKHSANNLLPQGRSLEEVDELFDAKLKAWQFEKYQTQGTGHLITMAEGGKMEDILEAKTQGGRVEVQPKADEEKV